MSRWALHYQDSNPAALPSLFQPANRTTPSRRWKGRQRSRKFQAHWLSIRAPAWGTLASHRKNQLTHSLRHKSWSKKLNYCCLRTTQQRSLINRKMTNFTKGKCLLIKIVEVNWLLATVLYIQNLLYRLPCIGTVLYPLKLLKFTPLSRVF